MRLAVSTTSLAALLALGAGCSTDAAPEGGNTTGPVMLPSGTTGPMTGGTAGTTGNTAGTTGNTAGTTGTTATTGTTGMMDAGMDSSMDAGDAGEAGCGVLPDADQKLHCNYDVFFDDTQKGCDDYPAGVTMQEATAACTASAASKDDTVVVSAGPCDATGASGYCSSQLSAEKPDVLVRNYSYDGTCGLGNDPMGGSWACAGAKLVPGAVGWTCLLDDSMSTVSCDGPVEPEPVDCSDPTTGDTEVYSCTYVHSGHTTAAGEDVTACKEYNGTWIEADATADCAAIVQPDGAAAAVFAMAACDVTDAHGSCSTERGDKFFSFYGGCNAERPSSGEYACTPERTECAAMTEAWECIIGLDQSCVVTTPGDGEASCINYPIGTLTADAQSDCDGVPGTRTDGFCDEASAVAKCIQEDGTEEIFADGICYDHRGGCEATAENTFVCLVDEPVYTCRGVDTGGGCTGILAQPGNYTCSWCVEMPQAAGWDQGDAQTACDAVQNPNNDDLGDTTLTADDGCSADYTGLNRCVDGTVGGDPLLTYTYGKEVAIPCDGTSEPVPDCVPDVDQVISCRYTDPNGGGGPGNPGPGCVDYPEGDWTQGDATAHCEAAKEAGTSILVEVGNACVLDSAFNSVERCAVTDTDPTYYSYNVPSIGCGFITGGVHSTGPFCAKY